MFNNKSFDSLPRDLQAVVETSALASVTVTRAANLHENSQAVQQHQEQDIRILDTPEEHLSQFIKAQNKIIQDYIEDNEFFVRVYASQEDFAKTAYPYHSGNMALRE